MYKAVSSDMRLVDSPGENSCELNHVDSCEK
jgi:hypothetical protein